MGGAVSSGRDNNELIDNLVSSNYIRSRDVERVFRALDRADYMTRDARDQAYKDLAWRHGPLHLSAPCIYSEVMEGLELSPGLSFLNVGSGTGYLSTLVGLILGSSGISHGVEVHPTVVEYANKRLGQFIENSPVLDEFDFCEPKYYQGNGLCIAPLGAPYDRVYCGAGCPEEYQNYFKQLIKVGGILVMPLNDNLVQVKRVGESEWTSRSVLNVSFATLRVPTKEEAGDLIRLEEQCPARLQTLCRGMVRSALRGGVWRRHPELRAPPPRPPPAKKPCPRRICIPIEDESDVEGLNALHDLDRNGGAGEMNALLSLVLSMGPSRVAGALRFDAPSDDTSDDNPDDSTDQRADDATPPRSPGSPRGASEPGAGGAGGGAGTGGGAAAGGGARARSWGRAERRPCRGMLTFELRDDERPRAQADDAGAQPEPVPSASRTQSTPADAADKPLDEDGTPERDTRSDGDIDRTRDRSQTRDSDRTSQSQTDRQDRPGQGRDRRRRRRDPHSDDDQDEMPAEVEIYLGKMGGGEATTSREMDWDADEEEVEDDEPEEDTETEQASLEADGEAEAGSSASADKPPRQKLDSGIGEMTPSADSSPISTGYEAGSSRRSGQDSDTGSRTTGRRRRQKRHFTRRSSGSGDSGTSDSSTGRRHKRRASDGGDARRVRLSILMKRSVKELPLPYALKKYVNLGRCFEF
ncbi:protein PRRC2A-like [Cydia fagiglandana]|uniref:protein PRRC2A-like n=1 Tax=Cydia fagiglandana TaxID=1458189 RepID=UPI002FEDE649